MEMHQLRYFVAVAEVGSFSGAARRCRVAQPSLSQQIKKLEQELGHRLFDRLGRSIALTDAGNALLPRALRILAEVRDAAEDLTEQVDVGRGRLSVGAIPTMAAYLLPPAIDRFVRAWPEAKLTVREDYTERLVEAVVRAELDLAVTSTPIHHEAVELRVLFEEPLLVAVPSRSSLARRRRLKPQELERHPTVFLDEVHCLGQQIESYCHAMRIHPRVSCHTTQLATAHRLVGAGLGVCLLPKMFADSDESPDVRYVEVEGQIPIREVAVITRLGRSRSLLGSRFVDCLSR